LGSGLKITEALVEAEAIIDASEGTGAVPRVTLMNFARQQEISISMKRARAQSNLPYGSKGTFRKITLTLPPEDYERLVQESARRKIAGEPNQLLSALLREAVNKYLEQLGPREPNTREDE
jgi:hypothetical protein